MKISKISANMFGQIFQNLPQYVRIRSGICENFQILFGWPIRPPKSGILFGSANLASKNCNFTYLPVLSTNSSKKSLKKSLSTHPVSRHGSTSTLFASCYNGLDCHQYIWKVSSHRIENPDILVSKCSAILAECASGCCIQVKI